MRRLPAARRAAVVLLALGPLALATALRPDVTRAAGGGERVGEARGLTAEGRPAALREVGFDQRLGARLPLDVRLRDAAGRDTTLRELLAPGRPVVLSLVYLDCPMLCRLTLDGLVRALKPLRFSVGREFDVISLSFDPRDTPARARERKRELVARYGREGAEQGWHFLTGDADAIDAVTRAVGFRYAYDPEHQQFAHPAGIVLVTPDGRVARYLFGVDPKPRDLRLGLVETANRRIGNVVDQVLLFCFHYDPSTGRYGAIALDAVRIGGALTVLLLAGLIGLALVRESSRRRSSREGAQRR